MKIHRQFYPRAFGFVVFIALAWSAVDAGAENIADSILKLDAQVEPVNDAMFQTLHAVMDEAVGRIGACPRRGTNWDADYAQAALKGIDDALIAHGFVYPDAGFIDELADGLRPFQMSEARRPAFQAQNHNERRVAMIGARFPGPFYAVDCDTASFIYLGVAEQARLPVHFIFIPGTRGLPGHAFVRWREGTNYVNWETMDGKVRRNASYIAEYEVTPAELAAGAAMADMTSAQVLGYEHYLVAVQYERRGAYNDSLRELARSLELFPEGLPARNNYAWDTAVGVKVERRDNARAILEANTFLNVLDDVDVRDTLAAAYANAGLFRLAVREEQAVVASAPTKEEYKHRLEYFKEQKVYREAKAVATDVFRP